MHRAACGRAQIACARTNWRLACPKGPESLVFPNGEGNPQNPSNLLNRGLYPALKRAGLRRVRFHDLRHTFGSHLIAAGVDLKTVSTLMGHSSISVTVDIYGHMLKGSNRDAIHRLDIALGSKTVAEADELTKNYRKCLLCWVGLVGLEPTTKGL